MKEQMRLTDCGEGEEESRRQEEEQGDGRRGSGGILK